MERLAIIGSSDLGQQIAYHAQQDGHYSVVGFFDDFEKPGTTKHEVTILGGINDLMNIFNQGVFDKIMIGIGYKHFQKRKELFVEFNKKVPFASIIHSSSYIDKSCQIGKGVFIYPGCVLDMNVVIGENVLLNTGCIIAHDTLIGSHSFFSPAVKLAGFVEVGDCVNLGIGTTVIDHIQITSNVRTGAGTVVIVNLESPGLYLGVPGKFIKP